jgi:hypothetical protein
MERNIVSLYKYQMSLFLVRGILEFRENAAIVNSETFSGRLAGHRLHTSGWETKDYDAGGSSDIRALHCVTLQDQ